MTSRAACRSCGSELADGVDFGNLPLGNRFRDPSELGRPQDRYPLSLGVCSSCGLAQLLHVLDADALHSQLLYFTSASAGLLDHERRQVEEVVDRLSTVDGALIVEVGSSDGGLLRAFKDSGARVLGVEPMKQSADVAIEQGVDTIVDVFTEDVAADLAAAHGRAAAIIANYVLELVPDPNDFLAGIAAALDPSGVALVEVPYLVHMVDGMRFDGIAHVRQTWLDVASLAGLCERSGLVTNEVQLLRDYRGGTLRAWIRHASEGAGPTVETALQDEKGRGVGGSGFLRTFAAEVQRLREELPAFLAELRRGGSKVAAYGGGIKASTALNACGLTERDVEFVVDVNPVKQGMFMPGPDVPIAAPQRLLDDSPEFALLLALDHTSEVLEQQSEYRRRGGRFVIPVPRPHLV